MSKQLAGHNVMFNYVTLEALINLCVEASMHYGMQLKKKRGKSFGFKANETIN